MKNLTTILFIFFFSVLAGAVSRGLGAKLRGAEPQWKVEIAGLYANAISDFPWIDYKFSLLPGTFTPAATCQAYIQRDGRDKSPRTLRTIGWVYCAITPSPRDTHDNTTITPTTLDDTNTTTTDPNTSVAFQWTQLQDGSALLYVESNMTIESAALPSLPSLLQAGGRVKSGDNDTGIAGGGVGIIPSNGDGADPGTTADQSIFIFQHGTYNISSMDIKMQGGLYVGPKNLSTVVEWALICEAGGGCM